MNATTTTPIRTKRGRPSKASVEATVAAGNEASRALGEKQKQADAPKPARAKRMARTPAAPATKPAGSGRGTSGGQQQASPAKAKAASKAKDTKPAGSGRGAAGPQQAVGSHDAGQQGASASGKTAEMSPPEGALIGGSKQVLIEEVAMPPRPGRPQKEEMYPFGMLKPSVKKGTEIIGQSFFIPATDNPDQKVAAARKRHNALFWVRKVMGKVNGKGPDVPGSRVWRGTPGIKA